MTNALTGLPGSPITALPPQTARIVGLPGRTFTPCTRTPGGPNSAMVRAVRSRALTDDHALEIEMSGQCDRPTPLNLVHHTYWNLDGGGTVDAHRLQIDADAWLPTDEAQIPTGEIAAVDGSPFDFRNARRVDEVPGGRIDNALVLEPARGLRRVGELVSGDGNCRMTLFTDQPAVQVYTGYKMDIEASDGRKFPPRSGICLETEGFPDAPNHPNFPSIILRPGETYLHRMRHEFVW